MIETKLSLQYKSSRPGFAVFKYVAGRLVTSDPTALFEFMGRVDFECATSTSGSVSTAFVEYVKRPASSAFVEYVRVWFDRSFDTTTATITSADN